MLTINNLPRNIRFKMENIPCIGFFYGKNVDLTQFLEPIVKELDLINNNLGIVTSHGLLKCFCTGVCTDSAAKPKLMKIKLYNGYFSCPYCIIKGVRSGKSTKFPFQ
jgi:hypothetical protein